MPAMVRWPGMIRAGSRTDALAATYDVFATMLSLAGARPPPDRIIDGTALSGPISTILTVLSWICVGIHRRGVLPSPVLALDWPIWC